MPRVPRFGQFIRRDFQLVTLEKLYRRGLRLRVKRQQLCLLFGGQGQRLAERSGSVNSG